MGEHYFPCVTVIFFCSCSRPEIIEARREMPT
jgi:hypothetical protein